MTAKRIRKNAHKKIDAIFSNSTTAKAYAEDNGFVGVDVSIEWVKKMAVGRSVEYYDNQNGSYTIRIHSNLWYELYQSNYGVLKKIRESEEPIKVAGLVGEVAAAYDKAGAVTKYTRYQLRWKLGGKDQAADFWLPGEIHPFIQLHEIKEHVGDLINAVELSADDYDWALEKFETQEFDNRADMLAEMDEQ